MAALDLAIMELAETYGCSVVSSECWHLFKARYGIRTCFVFGDLTEKGLPVACETDILGAVGSGMLSGAARGEIPTFFADLTVRHPANDNAELLWHCGPFPPSLVKEGEKPSLFDCKGQWEIKGGDITLTRLGCAKGQYSMFVGEAKGTSGPKTNGNYVWIETRDWPVWERKFVTGPYIHHVTGIHGKYREVICEALKYSGDIMPDCVE